MRYFLNLLLISIVFIAGLTVYSCNCSCYDEDNFIRVDTVHKHITISDTGPYYVQIGAFVNKENADNYAIVAKSRLFTPISVKLFPDGIYRVIVGEYNELSKAEEALRNVRSYGYSDALLRDDAGPIMK
jgi:hypothetical protein